MLTPNHVQDVSSKRFIIVSVSTEVVVFFSPSFEQNHNSVYGISIYNRKFRYR